ncbi:RNA-directed DNA polymerase [Camponotus japonicus]
MKKTFEDIKNIFTGPLLLAHYDPRQTLIVAADASSIGIGGILLQRVPDGQVKAVFHISKALTKAQQNYSQIEKEALALVTAVERFRKFVYSRHFVLQTDHRPLLALFKTSNTKGLDTRTANRLKRWALRLIGYDFDIEYVNSEKFDQADALSRLIQDAKQDVIDVDLEL